jgi:hypothetical protein
VDKLVVQQDEPERPTILSIYRQTLKAPLNDSSADVRTPQVPQVPRTLAPVREVDRYGDLYPSSRSGQQTVSRAIHEEYVELVDPEPPETEIFPIARIREILDWRDMCVSLDRNLEKRW